MVWKWLEAFQWAEGFKLHHSGARVPNLFLGKEPPVLAPNSAGHAEKVHISTSRSRLQLDTERSKFRTFVTLQVDAANALCSAHTTPHLTECVVYLVVRAETQ